MPNVADPSHADPPPAADVVASARPALSSVAVENRALVAGLVALAAGSAGGLLVFGLSAVPLSGELRSAGTAAAVAAGLLGAGAFAVSYLRSLGTSRAGSSAGRSRRRWRVVVDTVALAVTGGAIALLLASSVFALMQQAFQELVLDALFAALFTGVAAGVAAYVLTVIAAEITSYTLANLLALFLVSGSLASMLSADDPLWWHKHLSALGEGSGFSAYAFNITLVFSGVVLTTLSDYLTADLELRARAAAAAGRRVAAIRWLFAGAGVLLLGVGLIPVDVNEVLHTVVATVMMVVFAALIAVVPVLVPGIPRSFALASGVFLAAILLAALLMWPVGYFNLTAVELVSSIIVFAWLIVFVRTVAATVEDERRSAVAETAALPG